MWRSAWRLQMTPLDSSNDSPGGKSVWTDELLLGNRKLWRIHTRRTVTLLSWACFVFKSSCSHSLQMQRTRICCLSYVDTPCSMRAVIAFTTLRGAPVSIPVHSMWVLWWEVALQQGFFFFFLVIRVFPASIISSVRGFHIPFIYRLSYMKVELDIVIK